MNTMQLWNNFKKFIKWFINLLYFNVSDFVSSWLSIDQSPTMHFAVLTGQSAVNPWWAE